MQITVKDSYTESNETFKIAVGDLADFNAVTDPVIDTYGRTWTLNREYSGSQQVVRLQTGGNYSIETMIDLMPSLGFYLADLSEVDNWVEEYYATTRTLSNPDDQDIYPCYYYSGPRYEVALKEDSGTGVVGIYNAGSVLPFVLATTEGLGNYVFGVAIFTREGSQNLIRIVYNTMINGYNFVMPEATPGEKGFKPTGTRTNPQHKGIGGRGSNNKVTPEYFTDHIDQPGEPNENEASAAKSGFIKAYEITEASLQGVGACLWGTTLTGFLSGILVNPLDFIVSLAVFPYRPHMGASTNIKFGKWKCSADLTDPSALGENATGFPLTQQFRTIDFGTISIGENWGSFLDYDYTEIELYLPFIGAVSIDPSECMGGNINVQYTIDYYTGMCVANVKCTRPFIAPNGHNYGTVDSQHSYQGNCAIQIPLSRTDYGAMVGNLINACTQAISNPAQGTITLIGDAVNGGLRPNVSSKGNIVANSGYCSVLYPYIRITRPITAEPDSYQEVVGYPSYIDTTLGQCQGKCVCKDINLSGIHGATDSELERIKQACREGILV